MNSEKGGVDYYEHAEQAGLVIYWHAEENVWILNRSLGADFAWYYMPDENILNAQVRVYVLHQQI